MRSLPRLQRPENLWWFLHEHRGNPVVSPVLLKHMVDSFVASIREFAERQAIPIVHFERGQRKEEIARRYLARFKGREGVVLIGVAQEMVASFRVYQKGPRRRQRTPRGGRAPCFSFYRGQLDVNQYEIEPDDWTELGHRRDQRGCTRGERWSQIRSQRKPDEVDVLLETPTFDIRADDIRLEPQPRRSEARATRPSRTDGTRRFGLTRLSAWWLSLGIEHLRSRKGTPADNGGHERMHRDMAMEVEAIAAASAEDQQRACDLWRADFNNCRPHESLGMKTPSHVYKPSATLVRWKEGRPSVS